jgi:hypothetical protein
MVTDGEMEGRRRIPYTDFVYFLKKYYYYYYY